MNGFNRHNVVNQMTTELAERRRATRNRRNASAYVALALAILGEDANQLLTSPTLDRQPAPLAPSAAA